MLLLFGSLSDYTLSVTVDCISPQYVLQLDFECAASFLKEDFAFRWQDWQDVDYRPGGCLLQEALLNFDHVSHLDAVGGALFVANTVAESAQKAFRAYCRRPVSYYLVPSSPWCKGLNFGGASAAA